MSRAGGGRAGRWIKLWFVDQDPEGRFKDLVRGLHPQPALPQCCISNIEARDKSCTLRKMGKNQAQDTWQDIALGVSGCWLHGLLDPRTRTLGTNICRCHLDWAAQLGRKLFHVEAERLLRLLTCALCGVGPGSH